MTISKRGNLQRKTVKKRPDAPLPRSTSYVCAKCQEKTSTDDLKLSLFEADKNFLEQLLKSKDHDIATLRAELKASEK